MQADEWILLIQISIFQQLQERVLDIELEVSSWRHLEEGS